MFPMGIKITVMLFKYVSVHIISILCLPSSLKSLLPKGLPIKSQDCLPEIQIPGQPFKYWRL